MSRGPARHRFTFQALPAALVLGVLSACGDTSTSGDPFPGVPLGGEGGRCRDDGTCNPGLRCTADTCVLPFASSGGSGGASGPASMSGSGGTGSSGGSGGVSSGASSRGTVITPLPAVEACPVVAINGVEPPVSPHVLLGDRVRLRAPAGITGDVTFRLRHVPTASRAVLLPVSTREVLLTSVSNGQLADIGLDVPGTVVLDVTGTGTDGGTGTVSCSVEVGAPRGLVVVLHWDNANDLDAQLVRADASGRFCNSTGIPAPGPFAMDTSCGDGDILVCNYYSCQLPDVVDWDDVEGLSNGDPRFLGDASRNGPETFEVPAPVPGDYVVAVHQWSNPEFGVSNVQARAWVDGELRGVFSGRPANTGEMLSLLRVRWPSAGGAVCLQAAREGATDTCVATAACAGDACSRCTADGGCAEGAACNDATGRCQPGLVDDCAACGELAPCSPAHGECRANECSACASTATCSSDTGLCVPVPPTCDVDPAEPDNAAVDARAAPAPGSDGTFSVDGTLCRGDHDSVSLQVDAPSFVAVRARRVVMGSSSTDNLVMGADLALEQDGVVLARDWAGSTPLGALVDAGGMFIRLDANAVTDVDVETYRLMGRVEAVTPCGLDPTEPNDRLSQAMMSPLPAGRSVQVLCPGTDLVDHHVLVLPARTRVRVTAESLGAALDMELQDDTGTRVDSLYAGATSVAVSGDEPRVLVVRARRVFTVDVNTAVAYAVTVEEEPLPPCVDTALEPNNTLATASPLPGATWEASACDPDDRDHYLLQVAQAGTVTVTLDWATDTMDLDLYVVDMNDITLAQSARANTRTETLALDAIPGTYVILVEPYTSLVAAYPQGYALTVSGAGVVFPSSSASSSGTGSSSAGAGTSAAASSGSSAGAPSAGSSMGGTSAVEASSASR